MPTDADQIEAAQALAEIRIALGRMHQLTSAKLYGEALEDALHAFLIQQYREGFLMSHPDEICMQKFYTNLATWILDKSYTP